MATRSQAEMKRLMKSGENSDLTLSNGHKDFHVLREIVCPQSRVFREACDGDVPAGETPRVIMEGTSDDTMEQLISFLYLEDYEDEQHRFRGTSKNDYFPQMGFHRGIFENNIKTTVTQGVGPRSVISDYSEYSTRYYPAPVSSIRLYVLGEKYEIPVLSAEAEKRIRKFTVRSWSSHLMGPFVLEVCEAQTIDHNNLVDIIAQMIVRHAHKLLAGDSEVLGQLEMHKNLQRAVVHKYLVEKITLDSRHGNSILKVKEYEKRTQGSASGLEDAKNAIDIAKKGIEKAQKDIENYEKDIGKYEKEVEYYKQNLENMETIKKSVKMSETAISKLKTNVKNYIGDRVMHEDYHRCWKCRFGIDATLLLDRKDIDVLECGKCTEGASWMPGEFSEDDEEYPV